MNEPLNLSCDMFAPVAGEVSGLVDLTTRWKIWREQKRHGAIVKDVQSLVSLELKRNLRESLGHEKRI